MAVLVKYLFISIVIIGVSCGLILTGAINGWWHKPITKDKGNKAFFEAAKAVTQNQYVGNLAMATIVNGNVYDEFLYAGNESIDRNSLFQVASLSKWITSWGVMALVDAGKLELDVPVSNYLTRWSLPPSEFDNSGVTIRRLLSHTAGLTDGLGYAGFEPGNTKQSLEASLTNAADASPGANGKVQVGIAPGTEWKYSGGGYTLLQLIIEEVTGQSFSAYMKSAVFEPLGMNNTTFQWSDSLDSRVVPFYNSKGEVSTHYQFTSLAATSLYTSLSDLIIFLQAQVNLNGELIGRNVLSPETVKRMRDPLGYSMGAEIWGLGTMLYAPNNNNDFIIGHDGSNEPAINTAVRFNPDTGDGIIVLETGHPMLATELGSEWVFWITGNVDTLMFLRSMDEMVVLMVVSSVIIFIITIVIYIRRYWKESRVFFVKSP